MDYRFLIFPSLLFVWQAPVQGQVPDLTAITSIPVISNLITQYTTCLASIPNVGVPTLPTALPTTLPTVDPTAAVNLTNPQQCGLIACVMKKAKLATSTLSLNLAQVRSLLSSLVPRTNPLYTKLNTVASTCAAPTGSTQCGILSNLGQCFVNQANAMGLVPKNLTSLSSLSSIPGVSQLAAFKSLLKASTAAGGLPNLLSGAAAGASGLTAATNPAQAALGALATVIGSFTGMMGNLPIAG